QEALGDSTLIEHLDGACVQTTRTRAGKVLAFALLHDDDVDARQRELSRQHQARWPASGNHHCVLGRALAAFGFVAHFSILRFQRCRWWAATLRHDPGLAATPGLWHRLQVERRGGQRSSSFARTSSQTMAREKM